MDTFSDILDDDDSLTLDNIITNQDQTILPHEGIEFFECQKCGEYNIIKNKPRNRRTKRARHLRVDDVTWGSMKKYAVLNNVSMDNALMMLLYNARTNNVNYLLNERQLVEEKMRRQQKKKRNK